MVITKTVTQDFYVPNIKYDEKGNAVEILKVKPLEAPKDNRRMEHTRTKRHELSKQFK